MLYRLCIPYGLPSLAFPPLLSAPAFSTPAFSVALIDRQRERVCSRSSTCMASAGLLQRCCPLSGSRCLIARGANMTPARQIGSWINYVGNQPRCQVMFTLCVFFLRASSRFSSLPWCLRQSTSSSYLFVPHHLTLSSVLNYLLQSLCSHCTSTRTAYGRHCSDLLPGSWSTNQLAVSQLAN